MCDTEKKELVISVEILVILKSICLFTRSGWLGQVDKSIKHIFDHIYLPEQCGLCMIHHLLSHL